MPHKCIVTFSADSPAKQLSTRCFAQQSGREPLPSSACRRTVRTSSWLSSVTVHCQTGLTGLLAEGFTVCPTFSGASESPPPPHPHRHPSTAVTAMCHGFPGFLNFSRTSPANVEGCGHVSPMAMNRCSRRLPRSSCPDHVTCSDPFTARMLLRTSPPCFCQEPAKGVRLD